MFYLVLFFLSLFHFFFFLDYNGFIIIILIGKLQTHLVGLCTHYLILWLAFTREGGAFWAKAYCDKDFIIYLRNILCFYLLVSYTHTLVSWTYSITLPFVLIGEEMLFELEKIGNLHVILFSMFSSIYVCKLDACLA